MDAVAHPAVTAAGIAPRPRAATLLGLATFVAIAAAAAAAGRQLARMGRQGREAPHAVPGFTAPARRLHASAALLGLPVLADSALGHWRGAYENPGMFAPLLSALMATGAGVSGATAVAAAARNRRMRNSAYATAVMAGVAGTGFDVYNLLRRPGGWCWMNRFYAAPLGAPSVLSLSGLLGLAAQYLGRQRRTPARRLPGLPAGRALAALTSLGIGGTAGEAAPAFSRRIPEPVHVAAGQHAARGIAADGTRRAYLTAGALRASAPAAQHHGGARHRRRGLSCVWRGAPDGTLAQCAPEPAVWTASPRLLSARFAASAMATAAAALSPAESECRTRSLDRLAALSTAAGSALSAAAHANEARAGLTQASGMDAGTAVENALACYCVGALLPARRQALSRAAALGVLAGGLLMRAVIFRAGNQSAH